MELGNYSVRIPEGRELDSGEIDVGTRREFSLELGNSGQESVNADISVCGKDLGTWHVSPGRKTVVELSEHDLLRAKPRMEDPALPAIEVRFVQSRDQEIVIRVRLVFSSRSESPGALASVGEDNEAFSQHQASSPLTPEETVLLNLRAAILGRACILYQTDNKPVEPGKIGEGIDRHLNEVSAFSKEQIQRNAAIIHREQFGSDTTTDPWDCIQVEGPKHTTTIEQIQSASFPNVETVETISVQYNDTATVLSIEAVYETRLSGDPIQSNYNRHNGKSLKKYEVVGRVLKHVRSVSAYNLETDTMKYLMLEHPSSLAMRKIDSSGIPNFPSWHVDEWNAKLGIWDENWEKDVAAKGKRKVEGKVLEKRESVIGCFVLVAILLVSYFVAPNAYYWITEHVIKNSAERAFSLAEEEGTVWAYEKFLRDYPTGEFTHIAAKRARELNQAEDLKYNDFGYVSTLHTTQAYEKFLKHEPNGPDAEIARERLVELELEQWFPGKPLSEVRHESYFKSGAGNMTSISIRNESRHSARLVYAGGVTGEIALDPNSAVSFEGPKGYYKIGVQIVATEDTSMQFERWGVEGEFKQDVYYFSLTTFGL